MLPAARKMNAALLKPVSEFDQVYYFAGCLHIQDALHKRHAMKIQEDMARQSLIESGRIVPN